MKHIKFFFFAAVMAAIMALFEIQIEGSRGWAANLPTWKVNFSLPIFGMWGNTEKPVTGYHIYLWLFSFILLHFAFLLTKWSWKKELYLCSFYIFFSTFEGLLWFVFNPAWGWHMFRYGITWYKELWILGLPAEYWLRFVVGGVLYLISTRYVDSKNQAK